MPNRILSQKINVSNSISKLSPMEEVVFIHLVVSCDDFGRFYGNAEVLKGMMFPLRSFTPKQIEDAIQKLESEGMVIRYEYEGTVFLEITNWLKYQSPRAKASKYPGPDEDDASPFEAQVKEPKPKEVDETPVVMKLILKTGEFSVTEAVVDKYRKLYPKVDVLQEFRKMSSWCEGNPGKRKTKTGVQRFIVNWLNNAKTDYSRNGSFVPNHPIAAENAENPFRE